jgi:hypothetical protein
MDRPLEQEKPWRPADHPCPGPSWWDPEREPLSEHKGVPDAED